MHSMCDTRCVAIEEAWLFLNLLLLLHRSDCAATDTRTTATAAFFGLRQPKRYSSNAHTLTHLALASRLRHFLSIWVDGHFRRLSTPKPHSQFHDHRMRGA